MSLRTGLAVVQSPQHNRAAHPENARRVAAIVSLLEQQKMMDELIGLDSQPARPVDIALAHHLELIHQVESRSRLEYDRIDADTYLTVSSYGDALRAAGAVIRLVDALLHGEISNAVALVRPPGHHATATRAGGFCLFNNVAIAARYAQQTYDLDRVMIVDFDVHHGNGTQDIFYSDSKTLFCSIHLHGGYFYPGTGSMEEIGSATGRGYNVNIPLPVHVGDRGYNLIFDQIIWPKARQFRPQLILVSAGFDAHWRDPLAFGGLSLKGYAEIARHLVTMASELCRGQLLFVLEGGYDLDALSFGILNVIFALRSLDKVADPLGPFPQSEAGVTNLLYQLRNLHLIN